MRLAGKVPDSSLPDQWRDESSPQKELSVIFELAPHLLLFLAFSNVTVLSSELPLFINLLEFLVLPSPLPLQFSKLTSFI